MSSQIQPLPKNHRNDGIDIIRGLSIMAVILLHINILIPFDRSALGKLLPHELFNILIRSGYYGVMAFFVISGFLITHMAIKKWGNLSKINCVQFYRMRFARIAPCLIGLIIILSLLHFFSIQKFIITTTSLPQAALSALTFHLNWLEAKTGYLPGPWSVLWSLSIEETFYILFPLLCLFIRSEFIFKCLMILLIIAGPFARYLLRHNDIWSDHSYLSCMDGIAIGCLTALYINKFKINHKSLLFFLLVGSSCFLFIFVFRGLAYDLGISKIGLHVTILEIGVAFLLIVLHVWFDIQKHSASQLTALFRWFGKNSYEIYLTHMFVVILMAQLFYIYKISSHSIVFWYLNILLLSGLMGHLIATYFSQPLNQFLRAK